MSMSDSLQPAILVSPTHCDAGMPFIGRGLATPDQSSIEQPAYMVEFRLGVEVPPPLFKLLRRVVYVGTVRKDEHEWRGVFVVSSFGRNAITGDLLFCSEPAGAVHPPALAHALRSVLREVRGPRPARGARQPARGRSAAPLQGA